MLPRLVNELHENHVIGVTSSAMSTPADQRLIADLLAKRLRDRKTKFKPHSNNSKLLNLYLKKFPGSATNEEASSTIKQSDIKVPITRLRKDLEDCFKTDRSLWKDQWMLRLSDARMKQTHSLEIRPLYSVLTPAMRVWFHQCLRIPIAQNNKEEALQQEPQPTVVLSEPLFFFSSSLGAYLRFLDINHDESFRADERGLLDAARNRLADVISRGKTDEDVNRFVRELDLVPVRLYLPAGDSFAKTSIRRWFRDSFKVRVGYKAASAVPLTDSENVNLIILASRSSLPLVAQFQNQNDDLRLRLTENGISFDGNSFPDVISPKKGTTLSQVIFTNWITDTGKAHTYLMSNHTRALQAAADFLVTDSDQLREITDRLVLEAGRKIPAKFQIALEVSLTGHETRANVNGMSPFLDDRPIIY